MIHEVDDVTLHPLRGLAVLEPDAARRERVRQRCHAALGLRPSHEGHARTTGHSRATTLGAFLIVALPAGLVVALIQDVLQVFRR